MAFKITRKADAPKVEAPVDFFKPIPAGTYDAHIYNVELKEYGPQSNNAGRDYYNITYKIAPDQDHAGRRLFAMLLLGERWAPTKKNPDGYPNDGLWYFLSAVDEDGRTPKEFVDLFNETGEINVPSPTDLVAARVRIRVGVENDDYAWRKAGSPEGKQDEFQRNNVQRVLPPLPEDADENVISATPLDKTTKRKLTL